MGESFKRFLPGGLRRTLSRLRAWMRERQVRRLRKMGLTFARRDDLYSPLPAVDDLRRTERRWNRPSDLPGVRVDLAEMKALLAEVCRKSGDDLAALPAFRDVEAEGFGVGFPEIDAKLLYLMVREIRPGRCVEVGSGLSTWYCRRASLDGGAGTQADTVHRALSAGRPAHAA